MSGINGKFIVIDGTDGSGKTTQLGLLKAKLEEAGYSVAVADFPQYNTKSAGPIEEYLSGKYGTADEVDAYKASIFYAIDRFDASFQIRQWLKAGKIVLANRYTSANMGHQGCKISNPLERKVFFNWLYDLEYKIFEIPRPDMSVILHVESAIAQALAKARAREDWSGKTVDIHENNLNHLKQAELVYLEIANSFPNFELINCTRNNQILSREEINSLLWLTVKKVLQAPADQTKNFRPVADIIGHNRQIISNRGMIFDKSKNSSEPAPAPVPTHCLTKLKVERTNPQAKLPQKAHHGDAAYDLYANDYYSIPPYGQANVSTGIKMAIPDGYAGLVWDKSGLASQGIKTMGGVIDSGYRGEIKVVTKNLSEEVLNIVPGQKIAQIMIQPILDLEIEEDRLTDDTSRQANGFGSSGKF